MAKSVDGQLTIDDWHKKISNIFRSLGNKTPTQLLLLLAPDENVHDLTKIKRQELLKQYMSEKLGVEFNFTTPLKDYPNIYVFLVIGEGNYHLRFALPIPRSLAEFIEHEGRYNIDKRPAFSLSPDEAKMLQALYIANGLDPEEAWKEDVRSILAQRYSFVKLRKYTKKLHKMGLWVDEIMKWWLKKYNK